MVPNSDKSRFFAFRRVFTNIVSTGIKVKIKELNYIPWNKDDVYEKLIERTVFMMGITVEYFRNNPFGKTFGLFRVYNIF